MDTEVDGIITWSTQPDPRINITDASGSGHEFTDPIGGPFVTITNTSGSGREFTSTVIFRPVDTTDSASYTCTASVTPTASDTDYVTSSMEGRDTVDVTVEGELAQMMIHSRSE